MTRDEILNMEAGREKLLLFFNKRVFKTNNCWEWTGYINPKTGYGEGSPSHSGKWFAHRLSYILFVGDIPKGMTIDHICRNRKCVNPNHLRVLSYKENVLCGIGITANNAHKEYCPSGHPYLGDNLYVKPDGARVCRICKRLSDKKRRYQRSIKSDASMRRREYALKGLHNELS